jgi:hypothetical protein
MPEVELSDARLADSDADVVALGVRVVDGRPVAGSEAVALGAALGVDVGLLLERHPSAGKAGEVLEIPIGRRDSPVERVLLVGVGDGNAPAARRAGAAIGRRAGKGKRIATDTGSGLDELALRAHVEGLLLSTYKFSVASTAKPDALRHVDLHGPARPALRRALASAVVTARAVRPGP